jgi:hypothetical protein
VMRNIVYEPPEPPPATERSLRDLTALTLMLADGWQIEPPILARLSWAQRHTGELAYHVILARATQRSLIVLEDSPAIHHFLDEHAIPIV